MKVLLQNRSSYWNSVAGDSIQMTKTKEYLVKLGIEVDISSSPEQNLACYDVVHLFNIMPIEETYLLFQNARRQQKKIVLSPIYWDPLEFLIESKQLESFGVWWEKTMPLREEVLRNVELILPNSGLELEFLKKSFNPVPPALIVPNAADKAFTLAKPERFRHRFKWQDFLLSVGRICRRKNQLGLIKAAKQLGLPLVLIGPLNDSIYYQECRHESAGHKVLFIDTLQQSELASAYAAARVHALVSWYDTPGLVSLEAALAGCNIVSTDRGSAKEYFGELAYYCNPREIESIKLAIRSAWLAMKDPQLKVYIVKNYTWEKAALATLRAYQTVLEQAEGNRQ